MFERSPLPRLRYWGGRSLLADGSAMGVGSCCGKAFSRVFDAAGAMGRLEGETGKKKLLSLSA